MSPVKPQVLAAISAAIQAYYLEEEEALQAAALAMPPPPAPPGPPANLWGLAGRQGAMQLRLMIQRRSLK